CCILISTYIGYELTYDSMHENADNIYRICSIRSVEGGTIEMNGIPTPLVPVLKEDYPEVLSTFRIAATVKRAYRYNEKTFLEDGVFYAENGFLEMFSFDVIKGDTKTALEAPFTMILTESMAEKYFGDEDPIGKVIEWDNRFEYIVTAVVKDPPENVHFSFNAIASYSTYFKYDSRLETSWAITPSTYLLLKDGTDHKEFEEKLENLIDKYRRPLLQTLGSDMSFFLQPLMSIHLHSNISGELGRNNDIDNIYTFAAIALIIALIACINFINLATARSACRVKEVGMRKVFGAKRKKLIVQFLGESLVFAVISLILAIALSWLVFPYFKVLASKNITLDFLKTPILAVFFTGIVILVGLISGSYPAFFLSAFKPISALRGDLQKGSKRSLFRSILVVGQSAVSIILLICTIVIFNQQNFMKNKDLGFNKNNLLVINLQTDIVRKNLDSFKYELVNINGVRSATSSSLVPGEIYLRRTNAFPEGTTVDQSIGMDNYRIDEDFFSTMGIEIVKGRGYSKEITTDAENSILINETAASLLGFDDPVGRTLNIMPDFNEPQTGPVPKTIIGVYKDIHIRSLYASIQPEFVRFARTEGVIQNRARRLILRLDTDDIPGTVINIERKWKENFPEVALYHFFFEDSYNNIHIRETKLGNLIRAFAMITVIVACLGLFGLASFTAEQRTREIGIRKVLGSTVNSIIVMLCREFVYLILIANVIAWPVSYYAMNRWLQDFPYPVSLSALTFIITALMALIIGIFTVSYQSIKAAKTDPVESLRYE
ncbi:MAG: FtsX-like permease family protein, partial [bacterium]|nr:FtsX-like permease family protein [bacterium]